MIHVIATIELVPGTRDAFLAVFLPRLRIGVIEYWKTITGVGKLTKVHRDILFLM